eukprot:scaffold211442_cov33-Tisochrysis_lutea.AAC.2
MPTSLRAEMLAAACTTLPTVDAGWMTSCKTPELVPGNEASAPFLHPRERHASTKRPKLRASFSACASKARSTSARHFGSIRNFDSNESELQVEDVRCDLRRSVESWACSSWAMLNPEEHELVPDSGHPPTSLLVLPPRASALPTPVKGCTRLRGELPVGHSYPVPTLSTGNPSP